MACGALLDHPLELGLLRFDGHGPPGLAVIAKYVTVSPHQKASV